MLELLSLLTLLPPLAPLAEQAAAAPREPQSSDCHVARPTPIYEGLGWSHYVEITNLCDIPVQCIVATNVDPLPEYDVVVGPRESERIRTRYGSASPIYSPVVSCTLWIR